MVLVVLLFRSRTIMSNNIIIINILLILSNLAILNLIGFAIVQIRIVLTRSIVVAGKTGGINQLWRVQVSETETGGNDIDRSVIPREGVTIANGGGITDRSITLHGVLANRRII